MLMGDIENRVWELHGKGKAPSRIARALKITDKEARDIITRKWREDKERKLK